MCPWSGGVSPARSYHLTPALYDAPPASGFGRERDAPATVGGTPALPRFFTFVF